VERLEIEEVDRFGNKKSFILATMVEIEKEV
jgi:hypothetical protein